MKSININSKLILAAFIIAASLFVNYFLIVKAQNEEGGANITFPVAELGNCGSKEECKAYCDKPENADVCISFAEKNGLMDKEEAQMAKKAMAAMKKKGGGPGGCSDRKSCDAYCGDAAHIEECIAFAEEAGIMSGKELDEAKKIMPLLKKGEAPGGCKSKAECEAYCSDAAHVEECITFAKKVGLMSEKEEAMARKVLKDGGPGGCKSKEQCEAFCNDKNNQEACFKFAKDNDLISEEDLKMMKDGMGRMRMGMEQAPAEVKKCLEEKFGSDFLTKMENGELAPGPEMGEQMKNCFEKFGPQMQIQMQSQFSGMPEEMRQCIKDQVGSEVFEQIKNGGAPPGPELGDKIRSCVEKFRSESGGPMGGGGGMGGPPQMPDEIKKCIEEKVGAETMGRIERGESFENHEEFESKIRTCFESFKPSGEEGYPPRPEGGQAPYMRPPGSPDGSSGGNYGPPPGAFSFSPDMVSCIDEMYGSGSAQKIQSGEMQPPSDMKDKIQVCMQKKYSSGAPPSGNYSVPDGRMPPPTGTAPDGSAPPPDSTTPPPTDATVPPPPPSSADAPYGSAPAGTETAPSTDGGSTPPPPTDSAPTSWLWMQLKKFGASLLDILR